MSNADEGIKSSVKKVRYPSGPVPALPAVAQEAGLLKQGKPGARLRIGLVSPTYSRGYIFREVDLLKKLYAATRLRFGLGNFGSSSHFRQP